LEILVGLGIGVLNIEGVLARFKVVLWHEVFKNNSKWYA